jgi:hypothetical protein
VEVSSDVVGLVLVSDAAPPATAAKAVKIQSSKPRGKADKGDEADKATLDLINDAKITTTAFPTDLAAVAVPAKAVKSQSSKSKGKADKATLDSTNYAKIITTTTNSQDTNMKLANETKLTTTTTTDSKDTNMKDANKIKLTTNTTNSKDTKDVKVANSFVRDANDLNKAAITTTDLKQANDLLLITSTTNDLRTANNLKDANILDKTATAVKDASDWERIMNDILGSFEAKSTEKNLQVLFAGKVMPQDVNYKLRREQVILFRFTENEKKHQVATVSKQSVKKESLVTMQDDSMMEYGI